MASFGSNAFYIAITMDLETIGTLFKEARRRSRQTQSALARQLGMSRATLSALERGRCAEIGVRDILHPAFEINAFRVRNTSPAHPRPLPSGRATFSADSASHSE